MRTLLIDGCPLMYRCYTGPLQHFTNEGEHTGLRFGFLRSVASYVKKTSAERTFIVWDAHGGPLLGSGLKKANVQHRNPTETYKANRDHTRPESVQMWEEFQGLMELLSLTCYDQIYAPGYEADDVLATLALSMAKLDQEVYIATPDRDLWQVVGPRIHCWEPGKKGDKKPPARGITIGTSEVLREFHVPVKHLLFWRAVIGDPSDNLKGVGLSTAEKGQLQNALSHIPQDSSVADVAGYALELGKILPDSVLWEKLFQWDACRDPLDVNFRMMTLYPPVDVEYINGQSRALPLTAAFQELGFKSLEKRVGDFIR